MDKLKPFLVASHTDLGLQIWAKWDAGAEIYELFYEEECESYTGYYGASVAECRRAARACLRDAEAQ